MGQFIFLAKLICPCDLWFRRRIPDELDVYVIIGCSDRAQFFTVKVIIVSVTTHRWAITHIWPDADKVGFSCPLYYE